MLSKIYRLAPKSTIAKIAKRGRVCKGDFFTVKFVKNYQKGPRFAVNVGLWIDKRATRRNKIKRKIHYFIEQIMPELSNVSYDIILILRKKPQDFNRLPEDLKKCFEKLP